jgi:hypothetical protein
MYASFIASAIEKISVAVLESSDTFLTTAFPHETTKTAIIRAMATQKSLFIIPSANPHVPPLLKRCRKGLFYAMNYR